jgi:hypothetical protein
MSCHLYLLLLSTENVDHTKTGGRVGGVVLSGRHTYIDRDYVNRLVDLNTFAVLFYKQLVDRHDWDIGASNDSPTTHCGDL